MKYKHIILGVFLLSAVSCTKDFDEMNTNPNKPAEATEAQLFTNAQFYFSDNIGDEWNSGRMGMYYAQYWSSTYYSEESRYQIRETVNQTMWNTFYADVLNELKNAQEIAQAKKFDGWENRVAIAEIFKAFTFHYISDIYGGPIPYSEALDPSNVIPKYDSGEDVYAGLIKTLQEQVKILDESKPGFDGDIVYAGSVEKWKKFANSSILRIALRMIDAKPAEAQAAIAFALNPANGGIISNQDESAMFRWQSSAPNNNPINESNKTRQDFSMSKPFIDYLKLFSDPRLSAYALPLVDARGQSLGTYEGEVYGLRNGNGSSNADRTMVSLPTAYAIGAEAPTIWLDLAEVKFMLAEIAQRGLNVGLTGTAAEYYADGIRTSMEFAGVNDNAAITSYMARVPYNASKWKDCIGTQKWIAMYTQGIQGWFERLRLDFKNPYSGAEIFALPADGTLDPDVTTFPGRMTYPVIEASLNGANYQSALQLIGGKNTKAAKSWWDKF